MTQNTPPDGGRSDWFAFFKSDIFLREKDYIIFAFIFVALGILLLWLCHSILGIDKDVVLTSIILVPALIYLVVSGKLKQFKGPGGLEAVFAEQASSPIANGLIIARLGKVDSNSEHVSYFEKGGLIELSKILSNKRLVEAKYFVLSLTTGRTNTYNAQTLRKYITGMKEYEGFRFVVFVNTEGVLKAFIQRRSIIALVNQDIGISEAFLARICLAAENDDLADLSGLPGTLKDPIKASSNNVDALRKMLDADADDYPVVDEVGHMTGILRRADIISAILLALMEKSDTQAPSR